MLDIAICQQEGILKMQYKSDNDMEFAEAFDTHNGFAKETMLELVQIKEGRLVLRHMDSEEEPLLTIDFSDKLQDILGSDAQQIGQHMIQAAIQTIMQKQMSQWHANVYDQEPSNYS